MSTDSRTVEGIIECPVCGHSVRVDKDYLTGFLCEELEECKNCDMYRYNYAYGNTALVIGSIELCWGYHDRDNPLGGVPRHRQFTDIVRTVSEAKTLYGSETGFSLFKNYYSNKEDVTARLVLADFCAENNLALNEEALRK